MDFLEKNLFFPKRRPKLLVGALSGRNVGVDLQDANGLPVRVELQRPAAPNRELSAIAQRLEKFSLPAVFGEQHGLDIRHRLRKYYSHPLISAPPGRVPTAP